MATGKSLKINLAASWLNHAVGLAIGIVLMPFVLNTLGDEGYGTWIFINAVAGYSGLLYAGFGETICQYVAKYHAKQKWDKLNQAVNIVFFGYLALGTVALLIASLLAWLAPVIFNWGHQSVDEIQLVILILGLNIFLAMATTVFGGVLLGIQRFDLERGTCIVAGILRLVLTIMFLQEQWGLLTLSLIFLAVTIVEHAGHVILAFIHVPKLSIGTAHLNHKTFKEFISFSSYSFIGVISEQLIDFTDTVVIGCVLGAKAVVPYAIAQRLCRFIMMPVRQIGRVSLPRASELAASNQNHRLQHLLTSGIGVSFLLITGFFIGAAYFGPVLVENWIGSSYSQSQLLLMVLLGTQIIATPVEIVRSILFGMGHVRKPALINLTQAVCNLVLSIVLIRPLGLLGVALGTAIPVIVFDLGMLLPYGIRTLNLPADRLIRTALGPQVLALACLLGYSAAVASFWPPGSGWFDLAAVSVGGGVTLGIGWLLSKLIDRRMQFTQWSSREASS